MPVFRVTHYLDASQRFLEDSVLKDDVDVVIRGPDENCSEIGGDLVVVVLNHTTSNMQYRTAKSTVTVHKFTVMDGSFGVFRAQFNTCLSRNTRSWSITPGSTLIIKRWNWVWCDNPEELDCKAICRGVLLVHDYNWKPAPSSKPCALNQHGNLLIVVGDETDTLTIGVSVLEWIEDNSFIGWVTTHHQREERED